MWKGVKYKWGPQSWQNISLYTTARVDFTIDIMAYLNPNSSINLFLPTVCPSVRPSVCRSLIDHLFADRSWPWYRKIIDRSIDLCDLNHSLPCWLTCERLTVRRTIYFCCGQRLFLYSWNLYAISEKIFSHFEYKSLHLKCTT